MTMLRRCFSRPGSAIPGKLQKPVHFFGVYSNSSFFPMAVFRMMYLTLAEGVWGLDVQSPVGMSPVWNRREQFWVNILRDVVQLSPVTCNSDASAFQAPLHRLKSYQVVEGVCCSSISPLLHVLALTKARWERKIGHCHGYQSLASRAQAHQRRRKILVR